MTDPRPRPVIIEMTEMQPGPELTLAPVVLETDDTRPIEAGEQPEIAIAELAGPRRRRPFRIAVLGVAILIGGLLGFDLAEWITDQFNHGPVVGSLASAFVAAGVLGIVYWIVAEFRALAAMKNVEHIQALLSESASEIVTDSEKLVTGIIASLPSSPGVGASLQIYRSALQPHHSLDQQLELISRNILAPIDRRAEALIRAAVLQTVAVTAVSPSALMGSLFFIARGLRLVRQIAELYGGRPGFAGTWHLVGRLAVGAGTVGTVDMVGNLLTQKLGGAFLEKLSADIAESAYAAQKMATLGVVGMRMCRTIPFANGEGPSVSRLVANVLKK